MLWRYVKAQAWVLLCGGLVGPIFLAVYFATGQSDLLRWMFWTGLLITVIDVLAALALTAYGTNAQAKTAALEATGVLGLARITNLAETHTRINERPQVYNKTPGKKNWRLRPQEAQEADTDADN